ncbi:hypothetical protein BWQ96_00674 [Gracilariopsis chorda]|uniref:Uncharacterized protein n=1 Tax=Gracilariopsis chorda TaxID=448386 RepID=A0A2V3J5F1_9FLOR|nr:hypothetical protein BWQ96_00674 [Gracilariopsis chorda]|eukprot:PXF49604.1 hypothetical protein BWQ96_00674 [Gracilariopsis chorda]
MERVLRDQRERERDRKIQITDEKGVKLRLKRKMKTEQYSGRDSVDSMPDRDKNKETDFVKRKKSSIPIEDVSRFK